MKILKSEFYLLTIFYVFSSQAMDQQNVQKIKGEEFTFIAQSRTIPTLQKICLPALAVHISNLIKYDPTYNVSKFTEFLAALDARSIDSHSLTSLMHEQLNEWEPCIDYYNNSNDYGIQTIHFINKNFVWDEKKIDNHHELYATNIENKYKKYLGRYYHPYNQNIPTNLDFTISSFLGVATEQNVHFKNLETDREGLYSLAQNFQRNSWFTAIAADPQRLRYAIGSVTGEIFIITLNKFPNSIRTEKINPQYHLSGLTALYFTPNSQLYSCHTFGEIFVWNERDGYIPQQLPLKTEISSIISSADSSIVALQHILNKLDDAESSSIIDWNSFIITEHNIGKIIAITENYKILAFRYGYLSTYALDGTKLKTLKLSETAKLYGNEMPPPLQAAPLYLMTTEATETRAVDDYVNEGVPGGHPIYFKCGTHVENYTKTTFWLPKQLSPEELHMKLSNNQI